MRQTILLSVLLSAAASAQTAPAFEVATIKPSPDFMVWSGFQILTGSRFQASHNTLKTMVGYAYDVPEFNIAGGPAWVDSDRFDIEARTAGDATPAQARPMLRTLIEERFKLAVHRENRTATVYQLVVPKGARPILEEDSTGGFLKFVGRGQVEAHGYKMSGLATYLQTLLRQPVVDKTGLTAQYNFKLTWVPDEAQAGAPGAQPGLAGVSNDGPFLFTALQEQLGLKLESAKAPVEMIIIDHAEKPSEN
jgi:uncharacterized protein (TIGR03435 family)